MKRFTIHLLIVLILCGVFCDVYFSVSLLSSGRIWISDSEVYAADDWESVTQDDLVTAFRYYCKSRNLVINGSIADALTSFTTTTFNNICNTLGIDVTALQADLKKTVEGNLGLRFLFNQQGVLAYNRIFAEFLQNNDLSVGDEDVNKTVYSGKYFTDDDGNSCLVYITSSFVSNVSISDSPIISYGSTYKYSHNNLMSTFVDDGTRNLSFNINGNTYTQVVAYKHIDKDSNVVANFNRALINESTRRGYTINRLVNFASISGSKGSRVWEGNFCIIYNTSDDSYYIGTYSHVTVRNGGYYGNGNNLLPSEEGIDIGIKLEDSENQIPDTDITVTSPVINNNTYNTNWTIIYNDGDTYSTDDNEPTPDTSPDGGGGGGSGDPDQPSPSGPDLPDWESPHGTGTIGSDGTFDFDIPFSLPDLNIDWSLKNIGNKFPFCIPSDIVSFYQVLAVEPEAPAIDAHIPLGSFYDWHFEADFSQYDNWARIIRIVEYVGFVITLIYFTVKLVKG